MVGESGDNPRSNLTIFASAPSNTSSSWVIIISYFTALLKFVNTSTNLLLFSESMWTIGSSKMKYPSL